MYKHSGKESQPFKWFLAFVIFVIVLGFTMADVYGAHLGGNSSADNKSAEVYSDAGDPDGSTSKTPVNNTAVPVPEPMTFILIAGGLTALYAARKVRSYRH